jgi:hypothetical protein
VTGLRVDGDTVVIGGDWLQVVLNAALRGAQYARHNGSSDARYAELARAAKTAMAESGRQIGESRARPHTGGSQLLTTAEMAAALGVSERQARRRAARFATRFGQNVWLVADETLREQTKGIA